MKGTLRTHLPPVKGLRPMIFAQVQSFDHRGRRRCAGSPAVGDPPVRRRARMVAIVGALSLLLTAAIPALADPGPDGARAMPAPAAGVGEQNTSTAGGALRAAGRSAVPPDDLGDLGAWLDYKHDSHLTSLPD